MTTPDTDAAERFEYALSVIEPVMPQLTDAVRVAHREALAQARAAGAAGERERIRALPARLRSEGWFIDFHFDSTLRNILDAPAEGER